MFLWCTLSHHLKSHNFYDATKAYSSSTPDSEHHLFLCPHIIAGHFLPLEAFFLELFYPKSWPDMFFQYWSQKSISSESIYYLNCITPNICWNKLEKIVLKKSSYMFSVLLIFAYMQTHYFRLEYRYSYSSIVILLMNIDLLSK